MKLEVKMVGKHVGIKVRVDLASRFTSLPSAK